MLAWSQHRAAFAQALPRLGPILLTTLSTAFSLLSAAACSAAVFLLRASTRTGVDGSRFRQSSKSTPESYCAIEFLDHVSALSEATGTTVPVSLDLGSSPSIQPSEGSRSRVRWTRGAMIGRDWDGKFETWNLRDAGQKQNGSGVPWITNAYVALAELGSHSVIRTCRSAGRIPSFRMETCVRFDPRSVAQWLRRN